MKVRAFWLACASIAVLTTAWADDVPVPGTSASFKSVIRQQIGDEKYDMILTGTAIRQKKVIVNFNVYAIASYVDKNAKVDPNQLSLADVVKQLQLVLEREVSGPEIAENFRRMIEVNHGNSFEKEVNVLVQYVSKNPSKKGMAFASPTFLGLACTATSSARNHS